MKDGSGKIFIRETEKNGVIPACISFHFSAAVLRPMKLHVQNNHKFLATIRFRMYCEIFKVQTD
jgi:hypothetical protein